MEQVSHGAEERCLGRWLACRHGLPTREIGPVGRNQGAGAVRQDQDQTPPTLSVEAAEDFERLPFKWVMWPNDPDESRPLDVGSVSCLPSIASITRRCSRVCLCSPRRYDAGSKPAWSSLARWTRRRWARRKAASSRPCSPISRSTAWSVCSAPSAPTAARSPPACGGGATEASTSSGMPTTSWSPPPRGRCSKATSSRAWPSSSPAAGWS